MRKAGLAVAAGLAAMTDAAKPGVSTLELDAVAREVLAEHGATSHSWATPARRRFRASSAPRATTGSCTASRAAMTCWPRAT